MHGQTGTTSNTFTDYTAVHGPPVENPWYRGTAKWAHPLDSAAIMVGTGSSPLY